MQYNYLFGPVPSRRLGISLGVDLVPMKTCTLNCIYCECGWTNKRHLPTDGFPGRELIADSLKKKLLEMKADLADTKK